MFSNDRSARQSSGGKSFFSRSKKDRGNNDGSRQPDVPSIPSMYSASTVGSRHSHRSSTSTLDQDDYSSKSAQEGLNMQAGVITSIPYDSMPRDNKPPVHVDHSDRPSNRREPQPHHLNKGGGDFHQYPAFEASTGFAPRPPRHSSNPRNGTVRSIESDSATLNSGYAPSRNSSDHGSVRSNSSHDRRGQLQANGSSTSIPSFHHDSFALPPFTVSVAREKERQLQQLNANNPAAFSSTTSFSPEGFHLQKPSDKKTIEKEFMELMLKRGWKSLPEQARRQMEAYPIDKKWTLVYQDRLAEWQGEQKRRQTARSTITNNDGFAILGRVDEEGSPEWFVKKVLEGSITPKQLQSLSVSLRTQPIGWVKRFIEAQGQVALTNTLGKLNKRQGSGPAPASGSTTERDLDREYDIVKCLKALMNNKYGADDALQHGTIVMSLAASLTSPRLNTRKLVSELLTFLCHWADGEGHLKVLQALDHLKAQQGENGRFDSWMRIVEVTIDGRGKMGSLVGASDEVRSGGIGMENLLMEYAVTSLFLVNSMVDTPEHDLHLRCHIRAQFVACGLKRILHKMEDFQYDVLDKQIERYRYNEAVDYEDLLERENSSVHESMEGEGKDLNDPVHIVEAIQQRLAGSREGDYFLSALQHLLLIRDNEGEDRLKLFQLVESMLSYVAMDRRLPDMDLKQSLNFSVQNLMDKLYTDSEARQAREAAHEAHLVADAAIAERDEMRSQVELGAEGLVAKLQKQLDEQAGVIDLQQRQAETFKSELAELQRTRAQELQRNELETRELYMMLRDAQDIAASHAKKTGKNGESTDPMSLQGILNREKLMDRLEMQLERAKTHAKLEGRAWQQFNPSDKLRELREKMEGSGIQTDGLDEQMQYLGSTRRGKKANSRKPVARKALPESTQSEDEENDSGQGEEGIVFERPRLVEMRRPVVPAPVAQAKQDMLSELTSKTQRVEASDDEGDGITTGPSHPSLESERPQTPSDEEQPKDKFDGPEAPPPPPMPGFDGGPPPPAPPMPSFSTDAAPPPPPPPMPGFGNSAPPPPPPPMPGFPAAAPPPPPAPPLPGTGDLVPGAPLPPITPPMAPPMPGARKGGFLPSPIYTGAPGSIGPVAPRPKKKLKALHWEKVDSPEITMWASHTPTTESKEEKYQELSKKGILDEIEKLFMAKEIKQIGKSSNKTHGDKKQIINRDLMHTMQISLAKFSQYDADEVVRMIIHCDREILDNGNVIDFLQHEQLCTIPDNVAKLMAPYSKDWTGADALKTTREQDPTELTRDDQIFLYTAYELHHYWKARMRALALTRHFEPDYDEISGRLKQIVSVSESLRDSVKLMPVFGLILDIGNYMNDSNKQAVGFKLSSLARLGMVKDMNNESTLMDYVERVVRRQYPQYEGFTDDISGVVVAQKINIEQLQNDAKKYIDNINNVQSSLDSGNLSDPKKFHPEDRVSQVVQRCMKEARRKAEQMQLYLNEMIRVYDDILTYFGDDNKDENARRDFFVKLANFLQEYKVWTAFGFKYVKLILTEGNRNLTRKTLYWKKLGVATKRTCVGSRRTDSCLLGAHLLPMALPARHRLEPWIVCWRNFGPLRLKPETLAIGGDEPDSRTNTKYALHPARRSRRRPRMSRRADCSVRPRPRVPKRPAPSKEQFPKAKISPTERLPCCKAYEGMARRTVRGRTTARALDDVGRAPMTSVRVEGHADAPRARVSRRRHNLPFPKKVETRRHQPWKPARMMVRKTVILEPLAKVNFPPRRRLLYPLHRRYRNGESVEKARSRAFVRNMIFFNVLILVGSRHSAYHV